MLDCFHGQRSCCPRSNEKEGDAREGAFEVLCKLKKGDSLQLGKVDLKEHSTQPPSWYNEGLLVKKLEELGIGRPSTYASTIKVLKVSAFLAHHFSEVTDYSFIADMETEYKWLGNFKLAPPPPLHTGAFCRGVVTMRCDFSTCSSCHVSLLVSSSVQTCFDDQKKKSVKEVRSDEVKEVKKKKEEDEVKEDEDGESSVDNTCTISISSEITSADSSIEHR
ncbi:hypothetical protein IFM89_032497 [Coptis chinensis]|uniref:Topo IA-type catalytic domain-containing protein n=1 Tax=Coptis chinensis TaxID=261450 RepID=A0A835M7I3_9MAGN|nr:hypothetical protein IFM89_032497 [Coptis chinensis]